MGRGISLYLDKTVMGNSVKSVVIGIILKIVQGVLMNNINEKLLDEKLEAVERIQSWSPRVISKLETFIRSADDYDLYKINPIAFAGEKSMDADEITDLFLRCSREGIFTMNWGVVCPTCGDEMGSFRSLKHVANHFFCNVCRVKSTINLDDHIMVTFTVNSDIRKISYHDPDSLSVEDYVYKYHYCREGKVPGADVTFPEYFSKYVRDFFELEPGEKKLFSMNFNEGYVLGFDLQNDAEFCITLESGCNASGKIEVSLTEGVYEFDENLKFCPGDIEFEMENRSQRRARGVILYEPPLDPSRHQPNLVFDDFLSGKLLLNNHTFTSLFRNEIQVGTEGIDIKDITILFTDLKGSTEIYERIGDMQAFSLVNQHFQLLEKVVTENRGSVIKTIGDSVMSTFLEAGDALKAAIEMNSTIRDFNSNTNNQDLILKIGLHKGPSIAVTMNDRLDYFGRTVNIASRIQHLANPAEINITRDIYDSQGIEELISDYGTEPIQAHLKGIHNEIEVFRIYSRQESQ